MFFDILNLGTQFNCSDIHLTQGKLPSVRVNGKLQELKNFPILRQDEIDDIFKEIGIFEGDIVDYSYDCSYKHGKTRFRVHIFYSMSGWSISLRVIPAEIPKFETLHLPKVIKKFTKFHNGLILVTGVTGSGKSTTLASIIDMINNEQSKRIITVEDPIEFVYSDKRSTIIQRELGKNVKSFSGSIKEAMRQDPDIMLVGELRDLDTIKNAITLAETGHLVFATIHTKSVAETFDRIIDVFPAEQQKQIRVQLSNTIKGIITQRLVTKKGGGRVPACEIMVMNNGIRSLVAQQGKIAGIEDQMLMNHNRNGSQIFLQSLAFLVKKGLIERKTALDNCATGEEEEKLIRFLSESER